MPRWRFYIVGGEDSDLLHTYGIVEADSEQEAFDEGYETFIPDGAGSMEEAQRLWPDVEDFGPQYVGDPDEGPFFTVEELTDDEADSFDDDDLDDGE